LHAAVANQYTRYNLILIGPFSVGAAWLIGRGMQYLADRYLAPYQRSPREAQPIRPISEA